MKKLEQFWLKYTKKLIWNKLPKKGYLKFKNNKIGWFPDGQLNVFENCIQRHIDEGIGEKIAVFYVNEKSEIRSYSFYEIKTLVNRFVNLITSIKNIKKIMIHAHASIDTTVALLACAKLGIHFSVIFEELENQAILKRSELFKPDLIFSNKLNKKNIKLNSKIKILKLESYLKFKDKNHELKYFKSNRSLFTLFTSGSTGIPKGITHSSGGYLTYAMFTSEKYFGVTSKSIMMCASDAGWINGHTYSLFGPLSIGATTIILQKPTLLLNIEILKKVLALKCSILYLPVTLIRMMRSIYQNTKFLNKDIETVGSMGEPLANEVGKWLVKNFSKKNSPIINTYFQTETGGIVTAHKYNQKIIDKLYGAVGIPIQNQLKLNKLDNKKKEIKIITPWPGQMKQVLNGNKVWNTYYDNQGNFRLFDYASKQNKNIFIHGRTDDVINIVGHRIGSAEIESLILEIKYIIECCAVSIEDYLKGHEIVIFNTSKTKIINIQDKIEKKLVENFGRYAIPKKILRVSELPKTRSGKFMRRILRDLLKKKSIKMLSDTSTLTNKNVIKRLSMEIN